MWERFDAERTQERGGDPSLATDNHVSWSIKAGSDDHAKLLEIAAAAERPFAVVSMPPFILERTTSPRGSTVFDCAGTAIDKIVRQYPGLRWWMSKEGLVVADVPPVSKPLSGFDLLAGSLMAEHRVGGRLSQDALRRIAVALDTAGFSLKDYLQPAQWGPIAEFNQKHSKAAIKTFTKAIEKPRIVCYIRRRLYVARDRYLEARPEVNRPQSS
jgi:hypothetical protein